MLTVLLQTFYLGRINKLQLVFWDGLVTYSWSRMIWLTSKELLHLGRQHPIYFQFWEKHYPLDKTVDQELRHSGSQLCHSSGAWPHASPFTQTSLVPSPTLSLFRSSVCCPQVLFLAVSVRRVSLSGLAASPLLGKIHKSHAWTKSLHLILYTQVLAPIQVWFGSELESFSLASCDHQRLITSALIWSKECF